jgi:hypothetical protein
MRSSRMVGDRCRGPTGTTPASCWRSSSKQLLCSGGSPEAKPDAEPRLVREQHASDNHLAHGLTLIIEVHPALDVSRGSG